MFYSRPRGRHCQGQLHGLSSTIRSRSACEIDRPYIEIENEKLELCEDLHFVTNNVLFFSLDNLINEAGIGFIQEPA